MYKELVSVIMPTYNAGIYIKEAIHSVLEQTYRNLELVIVNDGSTDNTNEIIRNIKDNRIVYIELEKNMGRGFARNFAIANCKGKYITICDADDISLSDRIEKQVNFLEKNPDVDILGTQLLHFSNNSKPKKLYHFKESPADIKKQFNDGIMGVAHASCMLRKRCFENLRYEDDIAYNVEDFELFLQLNKHFKMASLPDALVLYRSDLSSVSLAKMRYHDLYHYYAIYSAKSKLLGLHYKSFDEWSVSYSKSAKHIKNSLTTFCKLKIKNFLKHSN